MWDLPAFRLLGVAEFGEQSLHGIATLAKIGVAFAAAMTPFFTALGAEKASRPNIVLILADDLGWGDLGCYGHPTAQTPNLDRLAKEGTRFTQFYVTGVTCCPSRTGFMTGKFPAAYREYPAGSGFGARPTVTELLQKAGYATGHFGKWHIGPKQESGVYGIDEVGPDESEARASRRKDPRGRDASVVDQAIRFVEKHKGGPFYVNVWCHSTHFPVDPHAAYSDRFKHVKADPKLYSATLQEKFAKVKAEGGDPDLALRAYLGDLYALDEDVGRLLKRIDELGLRENTLVVFSSDQGPSAEVERAKDGVDETKRRLRWNLMGSTGSLRGGKHGMYDGGVRSPFILRWPGKAPAGRVDETSVVSAIDWLPTLCRITGAPLPAADFDGEDESSAWFGREFRRAKPLLWKTNNVRSEIAIRDGFWKLHQPGRKRGETELYDLSADPGESTNLAAKHPDVVKTLAAKLDAWNRTLPADYVKTDVKDD